MILSALLLLATPARANPGLFYSQLTNRSVLVRPGGNVGRRWAVWVGTGRVLKPVRIAESIKLPGRLGGFELHLETGQTLLLDGTESLVALTLFDRELLQLLYARASAPMAAFFAIADVEGAVRRLGEHFGERFSPVTLTEDQLGDLYDILPPQAAILTPEDLIECRARLAPGAP